VHSRAMESYNCIESEEAKLYCAVVRAMQLSNREYQHRYDKLRKAINMKKPPSSGRIFSGYLVVRNLDKKSEYETWMPDNVFDEIYRLKKEK
jgi:hypothetical protein